VGYNRQKNDNNEMQSLKLARKLLQVVRPRGYFVTQQVACRNTLNILIPEPFDVEKHWEGVNHILQKYSTRQGIEANEHRELLHR
jgi:hypothetical protein